MSRSTRPDWPDDEMLVAYADGQLDASQAAAVAEYLAHDDDARRFVDALRQTGALAKDAYREALDAPVSDALAAMIKQHAGSPPASAGRIIELKRPLRRVASLYPMALAACMALMIGGLAGYRLALPGPGSVPASGTDIAVGPVAQGTPVWDTLERHASHAPVPLGTAGTAHGEVMALASFRDASGRICRELEATHPGESGDAITAAVACRSSQGAWFVEGAVRLAASPAVPDKDFTPAIGDKTSVIDGVLRAIGAKRAMSADEEAKLRQNGWR